MVNIKGQRIKIAGAKEGVGLKVTNQDSGEVFEIPMTSIGTNDPSKISFVVPAALPAGSYTLSIVTQFIGGGALRKEPKTIVFNYILSVE
jgi:hypothetical protein